MEEWPIELVDQKGQNAHLSNYEPFYVGVQVYYHYTSCSVLCDDVYRCIITRPLVVYFVMTWTGVLSLDL